MTVEEAMTTLQVAVDARLEMYGELTAVPGALVQVVRALAQTQTATDALLREMIKARPDLAREKADAVPQARDVGTGDWATVSLSEWFRNAKRGEVAEQERDAAPRRAEAAEKERDELRARTRVLEIDRDRVEAEMDCARNARDAREAECSLLAQERDALRADCARLSTLHEKDKADMANATKALVNAHRETEVERGKVEELKSTLAVMQDVAEQDRATAQTATADLEEMRSERTGTQRMLTHYQTAAADLRKMFPRCDSHSDCSQGVVNRVLDAAEGKAAPLSTPSPDAEDLAAVCARAEHLERERNSALFQRDEVQKAYREAKEALRQWGYAGESLKEMFPEHPNHEANSCVACMVRDRIARAENPPDSAF